MVGHKLFPTNYCTNGFSLIFWVVSSSNFLPKSYQNWKFSQKFSSQVLDDILTNPDPRPCDKVSVTSLRLENITRIYEVYGKQATKLHFSNWNDVNYTAEEVLDAINLFTNLETLDLNWHKVAFLGDPVGTLKSNKLKKVKLIDNSGKDKKISIDFLNKVLPENILTSLEIEDDKNYGSLLSKQRNIKDLTIDVMNPVFSEAFNDLKLEKLSCFVYSTSRDENLLPEKRKFMKAVVKSQPDVKELELVQRDYYLHRVVDDEIFEVRIWWFFIN